MHPQYPFISLRSFVSFPFSFLYIPAVFCLPPLVFSAVAPSHSHRGWIRLPHYIFKKLLVDIYKSLVSNHFVEVALPLIKVPRRGGCLMFFSRRFKLLFLLSTPQASFRSRSSMAVRILPPGQLCVNSPKNGCKSYNLQPFLFFVLI